MFRHGFEKNFPILHHSKQYVDPLVYFDNAATTQKPPAVIDAMQPFYEHDNANVHRGMHSLSVRATERFEEVRSKVPRIY